MIEEKPVSKFETREGRTARASLDLLYHVSREFAAALDLRTVLQRVLTLSVQHIGAMSGSIIVLDEGGQPLESTLLIGEQIHEGATQQLSATLEHGLAGWAVRNRRAVLVPDTSQDERWLRRPDDASDQTGPKSAVSAPILARDGLVGVMTVVHPQPGYLNQDHLDLLQAIVDQAGIAILNARLYAESQRRARAMTAVAESAAVITASLNLESVLERILLQTNQVLQVEAISLALRAPGEESLEFRAAAGPMAEKIFNLRLEPGQGIAGWVAQNGRGVIISEVHQDPRFDPYLDAVSGITTRAVACAPIRSQDEVIGVIEAVNPLSGSFDQDALLILSGIGSLAGTAIRHAQLFERLQAAHQRYRELFEDSIDPILLTDWEGRILEANRQAEITIGLEHEALCSSKVEQFQVVNREKLGEGFDQLYSGRTIAYEADLLSAAGKTIPVQVNVRTVRIEEDDHLQWILRDITERRELDKLRDDLLSMIYHDLRSPLANVISSLDILAAMLPENADPTLQQLVDIATRSTDRVGRLTETMLDVSRLEAGQPLVNRQTINLAALVREALEIVQPMVANKKQELICEVAAGLPEAVGDGEMIRRVLINLLENAVKYSPSRGKIQVVVSQEDRQALFSVIDNGPGIPPEARDLIFDKYSRLQYRSGPKGLGLGLAYCRLAIEAHGGRIWVEDRPEREGACFKFSLPLTGGEAGR